MNNSEQLLCAANSLEGLFTICPGLLEVLPSAYTAFPLSLRFIVSRPPFGPDTFASPHHDEEKASRPGSNQCLPRQQEITRRP